MLNRPSKTTVRATNATAPATPATAPARNICFGCLRLKKKSVALMPRTSSTESRSRSKRRSEAAMNETPISTMNAVRRSNASATQSGSAAIGIQNSGSAVSSSMSFASTIVQVIRTSRPACARMSRTRFCPNRRR